MEVKTRVDGAATTIDPGRGLDTVDPGRVPVSATAAMEESGTGTLALEVGIGIGRPCSETISIAVVEEELVTGTPTFTTA